MKPKPFRLCSDGHKRRIIRKAVKNELRPVQVSSDFILSGRINTEQHEAEIVRLSPEPVNSEQQLEISFGDGASGLEVNENKNGEVVNIYSSSSEESLTDECDTIKDFLVQWYTENSVTLNALTALLKGIRKHSCFKSLPGDARSILLTPPTTTTRSVSPGEYLHFGLQKGIRKILSSPNIASNPILLQFNFDGLPLFKSSLISVWPILASLPSTSEEVFVVGVWCGKGKPNCASDYLKDLINDLEETLTNGVETIEGVVQCCVQNFVCDAPAKAFVKQIKGHTAYSACPTCYVKGEWIGDKVVYVDCNAKLRTDACFRSKTDRLHHIGDTPFTSLQINLIETFPHDYMNLVCLGVARRLLHLWL